MKKPILAAVLFAFVLTLHAAELGDGTYLRSTDASAPVIKVQDGRELRLGEQRTLEIRKTEFFSVDNANTEFQLHLKVPYDANLGSDSYVLVVGGTGYRQWGSGSSGKESSSLTFSVLGDEKAKQVAKHFGIAPRYRRHPGYNFLVCFTPTKEQFEIGEDAMVNLRITNVGTNTVAFMKGGRNRAARDNQYIFSAYYWGKDVYGKQVEDIGTTNHSGGVSGKVVLKTGEIFTDAISLKKWFLFERAGSYQLHGSYYLDFQDPVDASFRTVWEDYVSADFIVTIKEAPNKKVEATR